MRWPDPFSTDGSDAGKRSIAIINKKATTERWLLFCRWALLLIAILLTAVLLGTRLAAVGLTIALLTAALRVLLRSRLTVRLRARFVALLAAALGVLLRALIAPLLLLVFHNIPSMFTLFIAVFFIEVRLLRQGYFARFSSYYAGMYAAPAK